MLTQQERDKFEVWCVQQADDNKALATQLDSIGQRAVAQRYRNEATAFMIVAGVLRSTQSQSL